MKGIILHGGHGTRLRPLTHTGPKQLLPIANKPMSQYCVEQLINAGIKEIAFIIGGVGSQKVKEYYQNGERFGGTFTYIEQDYPHGIAHAISLCKDFIKNEKFVVFLGDNIILKSIKPYVKSFIKSNYDALLLLCEVDNPQQFGIAEIKDEKIVKIIEKPKNPSTNLAVTGIYFLTPYIFEIIKTLKPSWRNELEVADALQLLIENHKKIKYEVITDFWKDTGTPNDIIEANKMILENLSSSFKGTKDDSVIVDGKIIVGEGTVIEKGVKINEPVIIGKNCRIGNDAMIGKNTSIQDNVKISEATISNTIIMSDCEINGNLQINNSIIGSNSKIIKDNKKESNIFLLGEGTKIDL